MKIISLMCALLLCAGSAFCQNLPVVDLPDNISLHFVSPEPIRYVDISVSSIAGDLPLENVLRIKRLGSDSTKLKESKADAVVTIAGESFMAQYLVRYVPFNHGQVYTSRIEVLPEHCKPLTTPDQGLSKNQIRNYAVELTLKKPDKGIAHSSAFGLKANVNHLATAGDYVFLDLEVLNHTNLKFDTDQVRFSIVDQKKTKATNVQSVEMKPEFVLYGHPAFKRKFRNVYVFKKFSFPGNKLFKIEMSEKQITGRVINLGINYKDFLEAGSI